MTESRPCRGFNEVRLVSGGRGSVGMEVGSGAGASEAGSNTSAGMNASGYVSGVVLKSL